MFGQIYGWLKAPDNTQTFSKINMSSLRFDCTAQKYAIVLGSGQEGTNPAGGWLRQPWDYTGNKIADFWLLY